MRLFKRIQWEYIGVATNGHTWYELYRYQTKSRVFRHKKVTIPSGSGLLVKTHNEPNPIGFKTKQAIAREEDKIARCQSIKDQLPAPILDSIASGELVQWRKYPNIFFVQGVDKARIIWEKGKVFHKYTNSITDKEQWAKFAGIFNRLAQQINA